LRQHESVSILRSKPRPSQVQIHSLTGGITRGKYSPSIIRDHAKIA
jgi:hypothetical protein